MSKYDFEFNVKSILEGCKPELSLDSIINGETFTIVEGIKESYRDEEDGFPKTKQEICAKHNLTTPQQAENFFNEFVTFGGIHLTVRRASMPYNEVIHSGGKSEATQGFVRKFANTLMAVTATQNWEDLLNDHLIGKEIKIWTEKDYNCYQTKKTNEWKVGYFLRVYFVNPGHDVVKASELSKDAAEKLLTERIAEMEAPTVKKVKKA